MASGFERDPSDEIDEASTVLRPSFRVAPPRDDAFVLTVVEGPDAGAALTVDGRTPSRVYLGQSPACELRLSDREVSRRHAAAELDGGRLRLTDLGSKNGTTVNGVAFVEALLVGGERVTVGSTTLVVEHRREPDAAAPSLRTGFGRVVGASAELRRLYPYCEKLAASPVPAVIEGETGTGKEVLAESIHEEGPRAAGPFVVFDCTAVPPNLVESELFGHERGAFTGAVSRRAGVFEQAHGGTLLIDEIGDLDLALQPKLLRALERSEIRRVGGDKTIAVDVRVLAATRRDLDREVQAHRFRDDLFHRLSVARVELPPLRRRHGDVSILARHFARQLGGDESTLAPSLLLKWEDYGWPGNVRELRNAVARYLAFGDLEPPGSRGLGAPLPGGGSAEVAPSSSRRDGDYVAHVLGLGLPLIRARQLVVDDFEQRYIAQVLEAHGGNVTKAAAASGIARRHFYRLRGRGQ